MPMSFIQARWRLFTSSWPAPMRGELKKYVRFRMVQPLRGSPGPPTHYVLFPTWLLHRFRPAPSGSDKRFLREVLWGQFSLYLSFRIQDDLFDRDAGGVWLSFASDRLQLESIRTFARLFPRQSPFWSIYFSSIESATMGLVRVDRMQRSRRRNVGTLLREYTRVGSVFTVGSAAVCARYSTMRNFRQAAIFWHEMAIAAQLLDDFEDLDQDWGQKRLNSVARIMLGKELPRLAGNGEALTAVKQALVAGGTDRIARIVLQRMARAEKALEPIQRGKPYPGLRHYREDIERMRRSMHRENVRFFFAGSAEKRRHSPAPHIDTGAIR